MKTPKVGAMSSTFIDVFYNFKDTLAPYQANVWQDGQIVERVSYRELDEIVTYCKHRNLHVIASDFTMLFLLHVRSVDAAPPDARALGGIE
jgi:hypothetical protein